MHFNGVDSRLTCFPFIMTLKGCSSPLSLPENDFSRPYTGRLHLSFICFALLYVFPTFLCLLVAVAAYQSYVLVDTTKQ